MMKIQETTFQGVYLLRPTIWEDSRGYFFESFNLRSLKDVHAENLWVQDNEARSVRGVLRGLHYQIEPMAQTKLLRVIAGEILDIVVDIREDSQTYGKHFKIRLTGKNKTQILIPPGFAHGYLVMSDEAIVNYKCNQYYSEAHQASIRFDDPFLNIDWELPYDTYILSEKDREAPYWDYRRKGTSNHD